MVCRPGGTALDPFAGSGTTGLACQLEGFSSILIEKDPHNFEIMKTRLGE
jgi:site-specific DNA-methyltransferase (adenine-specific)